MKILIVRLMGGLGNQLFQYATAKAIAAKAGCRVLFDTSSYDTDAYGRKCTLEMYNVDFTGFRSGIWKDLITPGNRVYGMAERLRLIDWKRERSFSLHHNLELFHRPLIYLDGYWQSEEYFKDVRGQLIAQFRPAQSTVNIKDFVNCDGSLVAVHFRRLHGKYADKNAPVDNRYGTLPLKYYLDAFKSIKALVENPLFVVFADDMKWCKENLTGIEEPIFYFDDHQVKEDYLQLALISQCDHHIIANSSYSWWGAWLCTNPNQIVIRPSQPFIDSSLLYEKHYPENWVSI